MRPRRSASNLGMSLFCLGLLVAAAGLGFWLARRDDDRGQAAALEARLAALEERVAAAEAADLITLPLDLQHPVQQLQRQVDELRGQVARLQTHSETATPPPSVRLEVPRQKQSHNLSCESAAASMAAHYLGRPLTEAEVLNALPRDENPHRGFRGNVDGPTGGLEDYGVYAGPVAEVLRAYGLHAEPVEGALAGIRQALARGHPVLAWITYETWVQTPTQVLLSSGETVTLVNYEHVVVMTGYDHLCRADRCRPAGLWVNDPFDGQEKYYADADLARAMGYLGHMALEISLDNAP